MTEPTRSAEPTWWHEAPQVVVYGPNLRKTISIALLMGTILFSINQLDVVITGHATTLVWVKSAITYLVPFCVANGGVLVATQRREPH